MFVQILGMSTTFEAVLDNYRPTERPTSASSDDPPSDNERGCFDENSDGSSSVSGYEEGRNSIGIENVHKFKNRRSFSKSRRRRI